MYKQVMSGIPGIEFYPIVALLLFFGFFTSVIIWYFMAERSPKWKQRLEILSRQPLEDGTESSTLTTIA
jgi:cytochrome c oxidase cbb3-type subunit IV